MFHTRTHVEVEHCLVLIILPPYLLNNSYNMDSSSPILKPTIVLIFLLASGQQSVLAHDPLRRTYSEKTLRAVKQSWHFQTQPWEILHEEVVEEKTRAWKRWPPSETGRALHRFQRQEEVERHKGLTLEWVRDLFVPITCQDMFSALCFWWGHSLAHQSQPSPIYFFS